MPPLRLHRSAVALALVACAGAALAAEPGLALKRVMLSSGGVGYFEYEATISGDADLSLPVRRDRVDDVLKSLVVYDDRGGIGTIGLPGREPLRERFRELPFGPEALESPQALLTALRGQEVRIAGSRELAGRLLAVTAEAAGVPGGDATVTRHRLSLITADGLRQVILEDIDALRLADPKLQARLDAALAAVAGEGDRERRTLTLHTTGQGVRTVRVAYVVEAPLWKTAYRLTLDGEGGQGGLQGWAVLENLSGEDWNGVDLTVVSGNPVTFRQALYSAYYVGRPEVPVEVLGRILPRIDQGGVAMAMAPPPAMAPRPLAAAPENAPRKPREAMDSSRSFSAAPPPPSPRLAEIAAAESGEATTQVSFHHPGPVSVASGGSLMLPIVNRAVLAARLALYQPATDARHPLAAVRLANDGASGLPPGILTLYERDAAGRVSYVGDARLSPLPAGQERLLSFALDQKVTIDRADGESQTLAGARIADGVLETTITDRVTTSYTIAGAAREPRRVVIEHPRRPGWELVAPAPGPAVETTADAYRLAVEVPAGQQVTLTVAAERPRRESVELAGLNPEQVGLYLSAKQLPAPLLERLAKLGALSAAVAEREQAVGRLDEAKEEMAGEQRRLRDNLQAVGQSGDLGRRYLAKLNEQEDRADALAKESAAARAALEAARGALAEYIKGLTF